ncbi:M48 family metalloprotease [Faunimonas sp. B44]|uniref:M48 family metalloprotease n=1 Tax=Faunimonas sp. B44 TaxID=3461493 RepID=UPI0040443C65
MGSRLLLLLASALALAGCQMAATPSVPQHVEAVAVTPKRLPSRVEEVIGQRENPRVVAEYGGVYSNPKVEAALVGVVSRLVAASDDPSRRYKVTILNSPIANAFALPGGYLYVTRGLLALTNDSSELAAVLAHEIAHVIANHALARARIIEQADIVEKVATDVLSDPSAQQAARSRSRLGLAQFSRDQEVEADRIGIMISGRAGFDPFAASRFLNSLERYAEFRSAIGSRNDAKSFLASHPAALERRELAIKAARQFGAPGIGKQDRDAYLMALDGIIYGDDPAEGFTRGREYLHPRLSIGFRVPTAFRLENTKEAVLAAAGQNTAMRFDGVTADPNTSPADYLASGWVNGLVEGSIRETTVNGLPAATAEAQAGDWFFRIGAIRVGTSMYRMIFADRSSDETIAAALDETLGTFKRLTPADVARLRPLTISIVTAKSGDTVASLAARMQGTERRLELFRLLNGLDAQATIEPGQKVKLTVG